MNNFDEKKGGQHVGIDAPTYQKFARDKRVRTTSAVKVVPVSRRENAENPNREGRTFNRDERSNYKRSYNNDRGPRSYDENRPRASYNPNFTRDNRPVFQSEHSGEERPRRTFNRDGEHRSFNRDGEHRSFNRENRDYSRPYNREERPQRDFNRDYNRSESRPYNSFRSEQSGEERPRRTFNRDGEHRSFGRDHNREFNREGRSFNRSERSGGFRQRDEQGGFRQRPAERPAKRPVVRTKTAYSAGEIPESYPRFAAPKQEGEIRLNRYIAQSGLCSRREADDLIADGKVTVNGVVVTEMGTKVQPTDEVCVNENRVVSEKKVYILLNKPKGFVTTVEDEHAAKTVMDIVKGACAERIYPVGRLDKNSLGVLLMTNDGDLTKTLTHPSYEKRKVYQVTLDKPLTKADMEQIVEGITLEDGFIQADEVSYVNESKKEVGIEIHSGRNRIVRRIFEHQGYTVTKLDRVLFAGLTKKNLKRGQWRFLTPQEVAMLKSGLYE
ncbi:MAG: pseudouridine synthase [Rikenellaceae bacterium]|nr:pseudouridine synthase [Rikenellaceae bacterium]